MNQPPTTGGSIPLQEYRREIPPGWQPGDSNYPLRAYFDRLRLWYRIASLDDELIGPTIAGRLYGRAHRVAMSLRVPRPDGSFDTGDAALVRLEVDEVRDPATGLLLQAHIPSGVQFLTSALRTAFGQQDQDLATQSLERFFNLARGKLSLQEFSVEFDARFDEASDRAGLQMNEVARFFLFFKGSGLSSKQVDDIKLQVAGDYTRFAEARTLALRLSNNKSESDGYDAFYNDDYQYGEENDETYGNWFGEYGDADYDDWSWWHGYEEQEEGEWVLDYDPYEEDYEPWWDDSQDNQNYYDGEPHQGQPPETAKEKSSLEQSEEPKQEYYGKGKGKNDGCFNCGSKWHQVRDCPMERKGSSSKGPFNKGKGKGSFGKGKTWRWRPFGKGGKGKFRKGKGKGKKGNKGYGKSSWYAAATPSRKLDIADGIPDSSTRMDEKKKVQEFAIHTPPEEATFKMKASSTGGLDDVENAKNATQVDKKHLSAFNFAFNFYEAADYFVVRGEKRRGLIIDPGAASGLIGSETLRDIIATCVQPYGKSSDVAIDTSVTSPVSGISGSSDRTLGKVTIPLVTAGLPISFTGEIIGGEGSLCPALVGNPSLRSLRSTIFTSYFENGDGLLTLDSRKEDDDPIKMMRILLTDSGHYILPVDYDETGKVSTTTRREVAAFFNKVAGAATNQWNDVDPRTRHIFMNKTASYGEGDRGEMQNEQHEEEQKELCDGLQEVHDQPEVQHDENNMMEEDLEKASQQEQQQPGDVGILLTEKVSTTMTSAMAKESKKVSKVSHVHYDDTVWKPRGQQDQGGEQEAQTPLEQFHTEEDFPLYNGDIFPEDVEKNNLAKKYRAMPEEYYTRSGLRPITPWNFRKWFDQAKGKKLRWHFWEIFSGSGRLSLIMLLAGLTVGFPVDMRYGWNINNHSHQSMLKAARDEFCPGVVFLAPECGPWSVSSSSKKPEDRQADRLRDGPSVRWVQDTCWEQSRCGRGYAVEQPLGSAMWRPEDGSPLHLDLIPDNRQKQRVDQCMHGSQDEEGNPVQKATGLGSNIKFNATAKRCSGHNGRPHAHLRGQAPDGLNRTAKAAVYPRTMCQRIRLDVVAFLHKRKLLAIHKWPQALSWFVSQHFYDCIRCQLGRACPRDIEHTLVPGKCRHGVWAPNTNPKHKKSQEPDPIKMWKNEARKEVLDKIEVVDLADINMDLENGHYFKKLLIESINNALGIFSEAVHKKVEYEHWITDATAMSIYKELFKEKMIVKGVKVAIRPFHKSPPDPTLPTSSAYLRLHVTGHVKKWSIGQIEDLRMMSASQINEAIDEDDWMITIYGAEKNEAVAAPSTPSSRPRAIPAQPVLPPRRDDAALLPRELERPGDPKEQDETPGYEEAEEFEQQSREDFAPIKPNYNMKRVLERLPKLLDDGDRTRALQLLVGLHERLWHTPVMDFQNLLRRAGMPVDVVNLASEAVQGCVVCRKYVRLPNRPQLRVGGSTYFGETLQIDIFMWEGNNFLLMIDEATRFKTCVMIEAQDSEAILSYIYQSWMQYFGPPLRLVLDQQASLMGHDTGAECERLGITRCPRGTTQGHGADQHTGTGIVERHVQLLKLTMWKVRAELERQGLRPEPQEICQESAMAHNQTLNYGGVTPCMSVFGVLPRGFYNPESPGLTSVLGSLQTDVTVFERAVRIRQTALAQTQQSIIEDRVARANRTRPHQLDVGQLVSGTSEVEFYREVQGDQGWRGPALLLRLDQEEGVAIIQYQGKPYLVSLRHIRQYRGIYHVEFQSQEADQCLHYLMKFVEGLSDYKVSFFGWLRRHRDGRWYKTPRETPGVKKVMEWAETTSKAMTKKTLHGIMVGKAIKNFKPPSNTTGTLVTWLIGGKNYAVQENGNANHLKMKKISNYAKEDMCMVYFYYYNEANVEGPVSITDQMKKSETTAVPMEDSEPAGSGTKRTGPESRTVVIAPEKKKQRIAMVRRDLEFLKSFYMDTTKNNIVILDYSKSWSDGYDLMTSEFRNYMVKNYNMERRNLPVLFTISYKNNHVAECCLRTAEVYKVDQETNNIDDDNITAEMWPEVDAADLAEIKQFVDESAFEKIHKSKITAEMVVVDARWVRKKKRYPDRSIRIKSRLCARGFLDQQKNQLTTRSTTATRLSQRILVSQAATSRKRSLESIDVAGAFLKGFNFDQIKKALRELGIQSPSRTVIVMPPLNVFKHLAKLCPEKFSIPHHQLGDFGLLCNKPVYGLNDAPLAWQLCLHSFIKETGGCASRLDENSFSWKVKGEMIAMATTHVDDIALTGTSTWLDEMNAKFIKRFGKVTRQQLPFDHCGCRYEKTDDGYKISQPEFADKLEEAEIPAREEDSKLEPAEVSSLRSVLGALLWITATRLDVIADVSILQSRVTVSQVKDLKHANIVVQKVKEFREVGLHYRYLESSRCRVTCIHDASSASQGRHYAQEGILVCLAEDKFYGHRLDYETVFDDTDDAGGVGQHGGPMHVLMAHGAKAKRVSYSTSHAETLSMVGGLETSTLVMVRLAELHHPDPSPTLQQLTKIQEEGDPRLPVDYYGDCKDVFELLTGQRTLPQDKSQRLYILSLKEARLTGKMRLLTLVPTECMTSDSLTKPMVHESMLLLLTTGIVRFFNVEKHHVTSRLLPTLEDYDEHDIVKSDTEIMKDIEEEKKKVKIGHSLVLLGLVALCEKKAVKAMLAVSMFSTT